jgi:hypothetical protein
MESDKELELLAPILTQHFKLLGMQMHVGSNNEKSKMEAMFFPDSLKEAKTLASNKALPPNLTLPDNQQVQFTLSYKYLGSLITTELNTKIRTHIKKAKSTIGIAKHFFSNKDIDIRMKHNIYNAFTTNAALWGCESWNLSANNKKMLESFHHGAIRRILNIRWDQVRNERIRNKQVRFNFVTSQKLNLIQTREPPLPLVKS